MKYLILHIIVFLLLASSCMEDDLLWEPGEKERVTSSGVFIVNEGNFTYNNASVSFYNFEEGKVQNDIFYNANGIPLGDVAHSMTIHDSLGYIVINNSGKIYAFNIHTFAYAGKMTGFTSPRYMHFINDSKTYVTDLYAKSIAVADPVAMQITARIDVSTDEARYYQHPTEQMVQHGKFIFTNSWSFDDKILVIDSDTDELVDSITVPRQPAFMVMDRFNKIWVLCDGGIDGHPYGHEPAALVKINPVTRELEQLNRFEENDRPVELQINGTGDTLYYINRHVYSMPVYEGASPEVLIESPYESGYIGGYYSLGVDPASSHIFVADARDHVQRGEVCHYTARGIAVDTFKVGINPGYFAFKE